MSSPMDDVFRNKDLLGEIFSYLSPPEVVQTALTCKYFKAAVFYERVWKGWAIQLGVEIPKTLSRNFYEKVYLTHLLQPFFSSVKSSPFFSHSIIEKIQPILKKASDGISLSLEELWIIKDYFASRDRAILWCYFGAAIEKETPTFRLEDFEQFIQAADPGALENWCKLHQGELSSIESLHLSHMGLMGLPRQIRYCKNLKVLNLNDNLIQKLPGELGECEQVETLSLSCNPLNELPSWINLFKKLTNLEGECSGLTYLPDTLTECSKLKCLQLNGNQLIALPKGLDHCLELEHLFFNSNKIKVVPDEILKLKKLKNVDLGSNPLEKSPSAKEICSACPLLQVMILNDQPWQRATQDSLEIWFPEHIQVRKKVKTELSLPDSQNI